MWNENFVYVLNYLLLRQYTKTIHGCIHRNKISKPCWRQLPFSKSLLQCGCRDSKRWCLWYKTENSEHHHWILHVRSSLGTKFQLKLTILIFWTKFAQKRCFRSKTEKVNIAIEFYIFKLVYVTNSDFLEQVCPKKVFPVKNGKVIITTEFRIFELV